MNHKRKLPTPRDERITWTYWISRDSLNGELSGKCNLWIAKPQRVKHRYRVTWVSPRVSDHREHLGEFAPETVALWFGVYPETDLELVRVEQGVTERMLEEARKQEKR